MKKRICPQQLYLLLVACLLLVGCALSSCAPVSTTSPVPSLPANSPAKSPPLSPQADPIARMVEEIENSEVGINGFVLMRDGKIVAEQYFNGTDANTADRVYSCTKSVISMLTGIAIDEGYIKSVDEPIANLLDDPQIQWNADTKRITLKQLLTMSSGLNNGVSDTFGSSKAPIPYSLNEPMSAKPGEVFAYNNAGPHIICAILQKATGMDPSQYAQQKLFDPLGIAPPQWERDQTGLSIGGYGLYLTARDLAKLGQLYLNEGVWEGKQIVSKEWVTESTAISIVTDNKEYRCDQFGYGYLWWANEFGGYSMHGYAGQFVFVLPQQRAVAVFTSRLAEKDFTIPYVMMGKYVLPYCTNRG